MNYVPIVTNLQCIFMLIKIIILNFSLNTYLFTVATCDMHSHNNYCIMNIIIIV